MGLWAAIKKSVNSDLSVPLDTLIKSVQTTVTAMQPTINSIRNSTVVANGVIKSVQRGTARVETTSTAVTINSVTPSKCSVKLHGAGSKASASGEYFESSVYVSGLTATTLNVSTGWASGSAATFSWEVVEYY